MTLYRIISIAWLPAVATINALFITDIEITIGSLIIATFAYVLYKRHMERKWEANSERSLNK